MTLARMLNMPIGLRKVWKYAYTPPASPMKKELAPKATTFERVVLTPIAAALPSSSRIASSDVPSLRLRIWAENATVAISTTRKM